MTLDIRNLDGKTLVKLLKQQGCKDMTELLLMEHRRFGAPVNADGTFDFIEYCAWLTRFAGGQGGDGTE